LLRSGRNEERVFSPFFSLEEKNEKNRANAVRRPANSSTCLFYKKLLPSVVKQFVKWPAVVAVRVPRLSTQWRICAVVRVGLRIDGDAVVMRRCVMDGFAMLATQLSKLMEKLPLTI